MEAVGTILALISVVTFGAGVWGLIRGRFARAHILSRKVAGGVLAGSLGLMAAAGAVLPNEDDVRVVTYGREQLAAPADDTTTTTTAPEPPTSTSAPTSTTTTGPATTISKPVPIAPVPTKTTSRRSRRPARRPRPPVPPPRPRRGS